MLLRKSTRRISIDWSHSNRYLNEYRLWECNPLAEEFPRRTAATRGGFAGGRCAGSRRGALDTWCTWGSGCGRLKPRRRRRPARARQAGRATHIGSRRPWKHSSSRSGRFAGGRNGCAWEKATRSWVRFAGARPAMPAIATIASILAIIAAAIIARIAIIGPIGPTTSRYGATGQGKGEQAGKQDHLLHGHDSQMCCSSCMGQ